MTFIKLTEQDSPLQLFGRNSVSEAERLDQKGLELNGKLKILDNQIAFLLAVNECPPTGSVKPKLKKQGFHMNLHSISHMKFQTILLDLKLCIERFDLAAFSRILIFYIFYTLAFKKCNDE